MASWDVPHDSTLLRYRHLHEDHKLSAKMLPVNNTTLAVQGLMLKTGSGVDVTLIDVSSTNKNHNGKRDPDLHQVKKGNQLHFGMKTQIGIDAESGINHALVTTSANVHDVTLATALLRVKETQVWADSGYFGIDKRPEAQVMPVDW